MIKERIKELRTKLGISQSELSDRINYSRGYTAELESGKKKLMTESYR